MYSLFDLKDKIKQHYKFSRVDVQWLLISIFIMALIVGVGYEMPKLDWGLWTRNFISVLLITALAVIVHETAHKIMGLSYGFDIDFVPWFYGLMAGLLLAVLSLGKLPFLAYSGISMRMLPEHRLGRFRYGLSYFNLGVISLAAPIANLIFALFFKLLMFLPNNALIYQAMKINLLFAVWNLLPIPPLDGANVMYANRALWLFSFGTTLGAALLLLIKQISLTSALLGAGFFGIMLAGVYFALLEKYL